MGNKRALILSVLVAALTAWAMGGASLPAVAAQPDWATEGECRLELKKVIEQATCEARAYTDRVTKALSERPAASDDAKQAEVLLEEYFARPAKLADFRPLVLETFKKVGDFLTGGNERVALSCGERALQCEDGVRAVHPNDGSSAIMFCPSFFTASGDAEGGRMTQWGTVLHEVSHLVANTDDADGIYTRDYVTKLARTRPAGAVRNADNYRQFAEKFVEFRKNATPPEEWPQIVCGASAAAQ